MTTAFSKAEIESEIIPRFGSAFKLHEKRPAEFLSSGISQIDSLIGGLPRGAITEIFGRASSGRASFLLSALAHATTHDEVCALVDTNNVFDPQSAEQAELNFDRLLWIRCDHNLEHAFKATDLMLQAGGFGLAVLDLGDVPAAAAKRIISSWWYRFRRALETTTTALVVIAEDSCVGSRAALGLELRNESSLWSSAISETKEVSPSRYPKLSVAAKPRLGSRVSHANLLQGLWFQVECHRPLYLKRNEDFLIRASL